MSNINKVTIMYMYSFYSSIKRYLYRMPFTSEKFENSFSNTDTDFAFLRQSKNG